MTFGQGPLLLKKINSSETSEKNILNSKVHDWNREGII